MKVKRNGHYLLRNWGCLILHQLTPKRMKHGVPTSPGKTIRTIGIVLFAIGAIIFVMGFVVGCDRATSRVMVGQY